MNGDLRATTVGFLGALVVLGALFWFVGIGDVLTVLSGARTSVLAGVGVVAVAWLSAWGLSLRTVLGALGATITAPMAVLVYAAATFANNVTPFGQAGGEPISALLISRASHSEYETGLAAIASVDALNFVPSTMLALVGVSYFAATITLGRQLEFAAAAVVGIAITLPVGAFLGWRHRYGIEARAIDVLTPLFQGAGRLVPRRSPPEASVLEARIEGFFTSVDRVAGNREALALALGFSLLGWIGLAISLWLSLFALGITTAFAAVLVVIPVGAIAGVTPLPGGLGGVEFVLVTLLVATTGVDLATATAAVTIHRGATYMLPTVVGGGTAAALGVTRRNSKA
jgi:uncharacterized protein (TIRG00374 family)